MCCAVMWVVFAIELPYNNSSFSFRRTHTQTHTQTTIPKRNYRHTIVNGLLFHTLADKKCRYFNVYIHTYTHIFVTYKLRKFYMLFIFNVHCVYAIENGVLSHSPCLGLPARCLFLALCSVFGLISLFRNHFRSASIISCSPLFLLSFRSRLFISTTKTKVFWFDIFVVIAFVPNCTYILNSYFSLYRFRHSLTLTYTTAPVTQKKTKTKWKKTHQRWEKRSNEMLYYCMYVLKFCVTDMLGKALITF